MATFNFTSPDGQKYTVTGPDDATEAQAFAILQQQIASGTAQPTTDLAASLDDQLARAQTAVSEAGARGELSDTPNTAQEGTPSYLQTQTQSNPFIPNAVAEASAAITGRNPNDEQSQQQVSDNLQAQARIPFMDEAKKLVGTDNYRGMTQSQIADALATADYQKKAAQAVVLVGTLPFSGASAGAGALINTLRMAGTAGAQSLAATAAGQAAESASLGENRFDAGELARDTGLGLAGGTLGAGVSTAANYAGRGLRYLREMLPGVSEAGKATSLSTRVDPNEVSKVLQGGDEAAQDIYRSAVGDRLPSQTYNPNSLFAKSLSNAESKAATKSDSVISERMAAQENGANIRSTIEDINSSRAGLQDTSNEVVDAVKAQNKTNYTSEMNALQDATNASNIKSFKLPETKALARSHIDADNSVGKVNLTSDARRTLNQFDKANISDIKAADKWKRTLNEKSDKAYKSGDFEASTALKSVANSLKGEIDSTLRSFNPELSAGWNRADNYYKNSIGDFGDKSVLGKISDIANPDTAGNALVRGQNARFNAEQTTNAVGSNINNGITPEQAGRFAGSLGAETRNSALPKFGKEFNANQFSNNIDALSRQADYASNLARQSGSTGISERAINNALADAGRTVARQPKTGESLLQNIGRGILSAGLNPTAQIANIAGNAIGSLANGPISRFMAREADFLSNPRTAQLVQDAIDARAARTAASNANLASNAGIGSTIGMQSARPLGESQDGGYVPPQSTSTVSPTEPVSIEAKGKPNDPGFISKQNEALYKGITNAETGGLKNPWIRTGAPDKSVGGQSSAWGEAQITGTLMRDMLTRHPEIFTPEEQEYAQLFLDQADLMLDNPNDSTFGYGKDGVLGKNEKWRQTYRNIARKFVEVLYKESGNDYDSFIKRWRGIDDPSYASRVDAGVSDYLERNA